MPAVRSPITLLPSCPRGKSCCFLTCSQPSSSLPAQLSRGWSRPVHPTHPLPLSSPPSLARFSLRRVLVHLIFLQPSGLFHPHPLLAAGGKPHLQNINRVDTPQAPCLVFIQLTRAKAPHLNQISNSSSPDNWSTIARKGSPTPGPPRQASSPRLIPSLAGTPPETAEAKAGRVADDVKGTGTQFTYGT